MLLAKALVFSAWTTQAIRILPSTRSQLYSNTTARFLEYGQPAQTVHVDVPTNPDDHLVHALPLMQEGFNLTHWAGHLPASADGDKYFFYWLFAPDLSESMRQKAEVPLIIWLNGGPACSSMDGLFIENGPLRLAYDPATGGYQVTPAPYSWHKAPAYTLYIDQPVGTGLSWTTSYKYPRNDLEVNVDFYYFLQQFFTLHKDKFVDSASNKVNRDVFFSGESYAGHYIPSMMNYILKQKDAGLARPVEISVKGGAIGNGWTDPFYQYAGAEFAFGEGLIGFREIAAFAEKEKDCQAQLNEGHYNVGVCFQLIDAIVDASHGDKSDYKVSGYDVRKSESKLSDRTFPPGHKVVETYLGGWKLPSEEPGTLSSELYTEVLKAIHASSATDARQRYQECTDPPYSALSGNDGKGVVDDVVEILQHPDAVQLLFFNGIHDIICNHVGNERFLEKLPWEHAESWLLAERFAWIASTEKKGMVSGYMKQYANLKFLKVMNAGHMVPMDVPGVASDMMKTFIYGEGFDTSLQGLDKAKDENACPVCPKCLERDSSASSSVVATSGEAAKSDPGLAAFVISYAWLVAGGAAAIFLIALVVIRRRNKTAISALQRASIVPQYELELRNGRFSDEPDNEYDEEEDQRRVS